MDVQHLREDRRHLLDMDDDSRIATIQKDIWINYRPSEAIFRMMNNIEQIPARQTAPALLVIGAGGTGKTSIISQIPHRVRNSERLLFIDMAEDPRIAIKKNLRTELAKALNLPFDPSARVSPKIDVPNEIGDAIKLRGIWGITIDELQDALLRQKQEQRTNMSIMKKLVSAEYGLKMFCFGTVSARLALSSNDEFKRRFFEFSLEDWKECEEFRSFLFELEEMLPLRYPSNLYSEEMVKTIISTSNGRMDKTIELLRCAASYAIRRKIECIDVQCLKWAAESPWGY
ncbi:TniB family NTP-binding protein [Pseudomonas jessenii]|uniref:TniB family NTP-binding protein n=1 Tax=Pseudomonas jessenii TaxID=77298 RepID=UPI0032E520C6